MLRGNTGTIDDRSGSGGVAIAHRRHDGSWLVAVDV
jgi:hypothetical protein